MMGLSWLGGGGDGEFAILHDGFAAGSSRSRSQFAAGFLKLGFEISGRSRRRWP